jgi:hypothetical protein
MRFSAVGLTKRRWQARLGLKRDELLDNLGKSMFNFDICLSDIEYMHYENSASALMTPLPRHFSRNRSGLCYTDLYEYHQHKLFLQLSILGGGQSARRLQGLKGQTKH